jgi:hypothetical protein
MNSGLIMHAVVVWVASAPSPSLRNSVFAQGLLWRQWRLKQVRDVDPRIAAFFF